MKHINILAGLVFLLPLAACTTTKTSLRGFQFTVGNDSREAVQDVELVVGDKVWFQELEMASQAGDQRYFRGQGPVPREAYIRWTNAEGKRVEHHLKSRKKVPDHLVDVVYFSIRDGATAVARYDLKDDERIDGLAWSLQEEWEGVPLIPGLGNR